MGSKIYVVHYPKLHNGDHQEAGNVQALKLWQ